MDTGQVSPSASRLFFCPKGFTVSDILELIEVGIKSGFLPISLNEAQAQEDSNGPTKRRVKVTLIAVGPGNNVDKAYYTQAAIETGPPLFEGCRAFANHISAFGKQVQPERTIEEEIGWYSAVAVEGEKLVGILNIFDGDSLNQYWDRIKGAIAYSKTNPGRNILGLSIHAAGDFKPMTFQESQWKGIFRFTNVKSCDFVTWPARGGELNQVLSEAEKTKAGGDTAAIFQTLKDYIGGLVETGAPGADEARRIIDQLGTSLKLNKQEDGEMAQDPNNQQPASEPNDESLKSQAHKMASESFKAQSEAEQDPVKKAGFAKMSDRHLKMSEAFAPKPAAGAPGAEPAAAGGVQVHIHQPGSGASAAPGAVADPEETEAEKKIREAEGATESEFKGKYINLLTEGLLAKSGLPVAKQNFFKTFLIEGEKNEAVIKTKLAAYQKSELMEANRGGHGGPRHERIVDDSATKTELKDSRPGLKNILARAKG